MNSGGILNLQKETVEKVVAILQQYSSVIAVYLTGSMADNTNTPFSDIDMVAIFDTDDRVGREDIFREVERLYTLMSSLWVYDVDGLFLYENGIRLDLSLVKPSEFQKWSIKNVKILFDKQSVVANRLKSPGSGDKVIKPKWNNDEGVFLDWFFWMFRQVYCWTKQSELKKEKRFNKLYNAQTSLASIREKIIEMALFVYGKWEYMSVFDSKLTCQLEETFTSLEEQKILIATRKLLDIYAEVANLYCSKTGDIFPREKIEKMKTMFDDFDLLKS
jgi:predicted nucleotidyltransferase